MAKSPELPVGPNRAARRKKSMLARNPVVAVEPVPRRLALTVNEVAWELHCSPNTIWSLIGEGTLLSFKVGRKRLIARSALDEFIEHGGTQQ